VGWSIRGKRAGNLEPLHIRQTDVEEHEVWSQCARRGQARGAIGRFSDDTEAIGLEYGASLNAEGGVVVDDQYRAHALDPRTRRRCSNRANRHPQLAIALIRLIVSYGMVTA
jgi:hypothetical protein